MSARALSIGTVLAVAGLVLAACGGDTDADEADGAATDAASDGGDADAEGVLEGEEITLVVPYDPGGGFDVYARAIAPYIAEELGAEVTVTNSPGAGGLIGAREVYQADPDGTTIGIINFPGAVFAVETGQEGVEFDNSQWTMLGRIAAVNPLFYAGAESGIASAEDLVSATDEVTFGIGGVGSDAFYAATVVSEVFGFPYQIIAGYEGSGEADVALIAGEVQVSVNSIDSALQTVEGEGAVPLMIVGSEADDRLPDVPTVTSLAETEEQERVLAALASIYDLERVLVAPPDTDEATSAALRDAVAAALANEDFVAEMVEQERTLNPLSGEEAQERVAAVQDGIGELTPLLQ